MLSLEQLSQVVKEHLGLYETTNSLEYSTKWKIGESTIEGRGLIATEDILPGEVLFVDRPLISGPRSGSTVRRGCTVCCSIDSEHLFQCPRCALLLCSENCQTSDVHCDDCAVITQWPNKVPIEEVDDMVMSRALTAIRALLLNSNQKRLLNSLQANTQPQHGAEITHLKQYFDIPEVEDKLMIAACRVLDANAFQIATPYGAKEMSMRGLYPVSSLMNHNCTPNTKYSYNRDRQMTVKATKSIRAGNEIFTSYSLVLWGTPARRIQLHKTKHFLCMCDRCADPTERGTFLAALKCLSAECTGVLLPLEPLRSSTAWWCLECGMRVPAQNICMVQHALGTLMSSLNFEKVHELERFLCERVTRYISKSNQIVVDLQCRLIWELGTTEGYLWHELSESRLSLKESMCRGTLRTVAALAADDAPLQGQLLYHLHATLAERARRSPDLYEDLKSEIETTIDQAYSILQGDISAPPDLELRYRYLGPGCDKPQQERFFILDA